jgi:hypothetical protein
MADERREFRMVRWLHLLTASGVVFAGYGAFTLFRSEGPTLLCLVSAGLAILFVLGLAEGFAARVVLAPDPIEIVSNFRRTVIPRSELTKVTWAKGMPVILERTSGDFVRLPIGLSGPHPNTLRAWIRRGSSRCDAERTA